MTNKEKRAKLRIKRLNRKPPTRVPAPGARLIIRGEEWVLRKADLTYNHHYVLHVTGLSSLVRERNWQFMTQVESFTQVDPKKTRFVHDESAGYEVAKLHIESLLRTSPPLSTDLCMGHLGALNQVPYQYIPASQALNQPRPRILIADGTGLGKTLEAGILLSELIRRGRGKRILVVALQSMLTQFQKEMWSRFSIPLVRLDSAGIHRVRDRIPVGHNPFNVFEKSIISIDTLKAEGEYRVFLEHSYWDVIVIDEAQNVAKKGKVSLRHKLADLLADRSDALIMLSATPHDGDPKSFASLVNMLDPTTIADPDNFDKNDLEGKKLFVRRLKKDIKDEVGEAFQSRITELRGATASRAEEEVLTAIATSTNAQLSARVEGGWLFRTVLEKAMLSSPAACIETVQNRITKVKKRSANTDTSWLEVLAQKLEKITASNFSKYQALLKTLRDWNWTGAEKNDRLVIFTERVATLHFLEQHIQKDLKLKPGAINVLEGALKDVEQQEIVDAFGSAQKPVRLLLSSDVGSEGLNLHYQCCRMIHFDIPWSIMILQQRNGRIDRYGQDRRPHITYLVTRSQEKKFKGDARILEILVRKEDQTHKNIGDPTSLMKLYDSFKEVLAVRDVVEGVKRIEDVIKVDFEESDPEEKPFDFLDDLFGPPAKDFVRTQSLPSLYPSEYSHLKAALNEVGRSRNYKHWDLKTWDKEERLELHAPEALKELIATLPVEVRPNRAPFVLTASPEEMMQSMKDSLATESTWPAMQYLWALHPLVGWATDKIRTSFQRMEAPVIVLSKLKSGTVSHVVSAQYPNKKGHTIYDKWFLVRYENGQFKGVVPFEDTLEFKSLLSKIPNMGCSDKLIKDTRMLLSPAIDLTVLSVNTIVENYWNNEVKPKLDAYLERLKELEQRHRKHVEKKFKDVDLANEQDQGESSNGGRSILKARLGLKKRELEKVDVKFQQYENWIGSTMEIQLKPYIHVVAALVGR